MFQILTLNNTTGFCPQGILTDSYFLFGNNMSSALLNAWRTMRCFPDVGLLGGAGAPRMENHREGHTEREHRILTTTKVLKLLMS